MTDSTKRFTGLADVYAKARPTYPDAAIQFIINTALPKANMVVADIGCGTGISSRIFAQRGYTVIGLEPNDDMRKKAESDATYDGTLAYRSGSAEHTGLDKDSIDLVLCAQSFHWFKPDEALKEFARVLKPGGWLALVWNERDESDPFTKAYGDALRKAPETANVEMHRGTAGNVLFSSPHFRNAEKHVFPNTQFLDESGAVGRAFSASYAPKDEAGRNQLKTALQQAFRQFNKDGVVSMCYETSVYVAQLK